MVTDHRFAMPSKASSLRNAAYGVVLALAGLVAPATAGAADVLTFQEALRIAAERSSKLVARDAAAQAARDMAVAAGQLPDPTLKLGLNNLPVNGPDAWSVTSDFMTMRSIALSQELTREAKRKARADRFEREADVAAAGRTLALAALQRDTALAWLDRHYQERLRETLIAQRDEANLQVEAADVAYRSARGSQADVFAARTSVALIEDRIAQVDRQIAIAIGQLARWVGPMAQLPLAAPPPMSTVRLTPADLDAQLAHALRVRDDVSRLTSLVNNLRSVKEQLRARAKALEPRKSEPGVSDLLKSSDDVIRKADALEDKLHNPTAEVVYDILAMRGGTRLYSRLAPLQMWAIDASGPPTSGMAQVLQAQEKELSDLENETRNFIEEEVGTLNAAASKLGLSFVILKEQR